MMETKETAKALKTAEMKTAPVLKKKEMKVATAEEKTEMKEATAAATKAAVDALWRELLCAGDGD